MSLQEDTPGQAHLTAQLANLRAEVVVQIPDKEPTEEHAQSVHDHKPHRLESLHVAHVLVMLAFLGRHLFAPLLPLQPVLLARVAPFRPKGHLHGVHAAQDNDRGQDRVGILVEHWVLEVVVVECDEDGQSEEGDREEESHTRGARVGERGIAHQAGRVDHGQLVD